MIDKEALLQGIKKTIGEAIKLSPDLFKSASMFKTQDSLTSALGDDPQFADFTKHLATHGLPFAVGGAGIGALAEQRLTGKGGGKGALLGGALGQGVGMVNDARNLANNELDLRERNLLDMLGTPDKTGIPTDDQRAILDAIHRNADTPWYDVYLGNKY